jgi:hypothetical protein
MAVSAALAAASCGTVPLNSGQAEQKRGVVPWGNRPGRIIWPRPLPRHFIPATARPCTTADLRVFPADGNGATIFSLRKRRSLQADMCATDPHEQPSTRCE